MKRNIVITGGAGFIGSHVVRLFVNKYPEYNIINLDKLTYAGNLANLKDIEDKPNYKFVTYDTYLSLVIPSDVCPKLNTYISVKYFMEGYKPQDFSFLTAVRISTTNY